MKFFFFFFRSVCVSLIFCCCSRSLSEFLSILLIRCIEVIAGCQMPGCFQDGAGCWKNALSCQFCLIPFFLFLIALSLSSYLSISLYLFCWCCCCSHFMFMLQQLQHVSCGRASKFDGILLPLNENIQYIKNKTTLQQHQRIERKLNCYRDRK